MSLTSFVKLPSIAKQIDSTFPVPPSPTHFVRKAPSQTNHYALIGTAFDYLMRFYLQKEYPKATVREWIAANALPVLVGKTSFAMQFYNIECPDGFIVETTDGPQIFNAVSDMFNALPNEEKQFNRFVRPHNLQNLGMKPFNE